MSASIKVAKQGQMMSYGVMPGAGSQRAIPMGNGYAGDPGIFGTLWGGIKGAVTGLVTGGPLGMVGGALAGALGEKESVMTATPRLPAPLVAPMLPRTLGIQSVQNGPRPPTWQEKAQMIVPGGRTGYEGMQEEDYRAGKASSIGHHWNKSGYFLKNGTWIAKGTKEVKNRRRNPLNPRALDRSMSRITSAKRASKKLGRITIRKAASCR